MICYETELTNEEILAINDFWLFADNEKHEFKFTVREIDYRHKAQAKRSVMSFIKKSFYYVDRPGFNCSLCKLINPVTGRADYKRRINISYPVTCKLCADRVEQEKIEKARLVLDKFRADTFKPRDYLEKLAAVELMALLGLISRLHGDDQFLSDSYENMSITNVGALDGPLLASLVEKGALIYVKELPSDVDRANNLLHPSVPNLTYYNPYKDFQQKKYRVPGSLAPGIYLNLPVSKGCEVPFSDIDAALYQQLSLQSFSIEDSQVIHQIVKFVQSEKLYSLLGEIQKEYKIAIENSKPLASLLDHLADNYAPFHLYFTFNVMARDTVVDIHKETANPFAVKHYFTKKLANYIRYIEEYDYSLKKTWKLPNDLETSFFEAFFSQAYLSGHFDWNSLSAKEVVALWLENVTLIEEVENLPAS